MIKAQKQHNRVLVGVAIVWTVIAIVYGSAILVMLSDV